MVVSAALTSAAVVLAVSAEVSRTFSTIFSVGVQQGNRMVRNVAQIYNTIYVYHSRMPHSEKKLKSKFHALKRVKSATVQEPPQDLSQKLVQFAKAQDRFSIR